MTATVETNATGPKTSEGKRIAARNATTHGLFARDVVLPRLGEDPAAYQAFLEELTRQLAPKNMLEQHYAEKIAAASWRLRRLHRWQAQLFEDMELPEDEILLKLDRVMRHETTLHRQIDTSVKMLGRELPKLFEGRVREDLLRRLNETERTLKEDPYLDQWLTEETRKRSALPTTPPALDLSALDTAPAEHNCQNEPAPVPNHPLPEGEVASLGEPEGFPTPEGVPPASPISISAIRKARQIKRQQNCQNEPFASPLSSPAGGGEWACPLGGIS